MNSIFFSLTTLLSTELLDTIGADSSTLTNAKNILGNELGHGYFGTVFKASWNNQVVQFYVLVTF